MTGRLRHVSNKARGRPHHYSPPGSDNLPDVQDLLISRPQLRHFHS